MVIVYFTLARLKLILAARVSLILGSLLFYAWGEPLHLLVLLGSTWFNYTMGKTIIKRVNEKKKTRPLLITGVTVNLLVLGYFKYTAFFLENINALTGSGFVIPKIILPLAISFYTFQQISFLIDSHRGTIKLPDMLDYFQYVCFFPQLLTGPIVRFNPIAPQHKRLRGFFLSHENISRGILLIGVGLFKKVMLADSLAVWANYGFSNTETLNTVTAWVSSLSFTFQVYFDFSGCIDMAMGSALLFNVKLPVNFDSPYQSLNIKDFWRKWHITLSEWLRDYLFLPIAFFTMRHIHEPKLLKIKAEMWGYSAAALGTFLLAGIWHGAGWNFLIWGGLHGVALIVHRAWTKTKIKMPKALAWFLTFQFLNLTWVIFRAETFKDAMNVFKSMFSFAGSLVDQFIKFISTPGGFLSRFGLEFHSLPFAPGNNFRAVVLIVISFVIVLWMKNSNRWFTDKIHPVKTAVWSGFFIFISLLSLFFEVSTTFIYFRF